MSYQKIQIIIIVFMLVFGRTEIPMQKNLDPKLKVCVTEDMTFACNMDGLQSEGMDFLYYYLQIVKLDPTRTTLATTTPEQETWVSKFVKLKWYPRYKLSSSTSITNTWLNLTIFDVHYLTKYGKYRCKLLTDTGLESHTDLQFDETDVKRPGFQLTVQRGLAFTCTWAMSRDSQLEQVNMSFWQVSTKDNKELLVASSTLDEMNSSPRSVCGPMFNVSKKLWVLQCHLDSVVSADFGTYQCRVTVDKKTVVSQTVTVTPENHGRKLDNRDRDEINYMDVPAWIRAVDILTGVVGTSVFLLILLGVWRCVKSTRSAGNHFTEVDNAMLEQTETAV